MKNCLQRFLGCLVRPFLRPGEPEEERKRKTVLIPAMMFILAVQPLVLFPRADWYGFIMGAIMIVCLLYIFVTKTYPQWLLEGSVVLLTFQAVLVTDLRNFNERDSWTGVVIATDSLMLFRCSRTSLAIIMTATISYLVLVGAERAEPYGLFDLPITGNEKPTLPPAGYGMMVEVTVVRILVLMGDFIITRLFATRMFEERKKIEAAVYTAEVITAALVRFDLDRAERTISGSPNLPPKLTAALTGLVSNLKRYKPYLPHSCLPDELVPETGDEGVEEQIRCMKLMSCETDTAGESSLPTQASSQSTVTPRTLNDRLLRKGVAHLATNFIGYLAVLAREGPINAHLFHEYFISVIAAEVKHSNGLTDTVNGDRVTATFNAARPCINHRLAASNCAWRLSALSGSMTSNTVFDSLPLVCAVASSDAWCGSLGTDMIRRFMVLSPAASTVYTILDFASARGASILIDSYTQQLAVMYYHCQLFDFHEVRKEDVPLWRPTDEKCRDEEEWMYQLEKVTNGDIWKAHNDAMVLFHRKQYSDVIEQFAEAQGCKEIVIAAKRIIQNTATDTHEAPTSLDLEEVQ